MTMLYPATHAGAIASLAAAGVTAPPNPIPSQNAAWVDRVQLERLRLRRLASYQATR